MSKRINVTHIMYERIKSFAYKNKAVIEDKGFNKFHRLVLNTTDGTIALKQNTENQMICYIESFTGFNNKKSVLKNKPMIKINGIEGINNDNSINKSTQTTIKCD